MELYKEILVKILADEEIQVTFPNLKVNPTEIVESESYRALQRIKAVLDDDNLTDSECFMKIEEIIYIFESLGISCGVRHDFG